MSVHAVKWAWSQQVGNSTRKLVLVALADHSNSDGECWPSLARVAEFAECDERTVRRHIVALENGGFVVREGRRPRPDGYFGMRTYRLLMDSESTGQQCPPDNLSTGHEGPCPPDTTDRVQRTPVSGKEPTTEPNPPVGPPTSDVSDDVPREAQPGMTYAQTLDGWLDSKDRWITPRSKVSDEYRALLDTACEFIGDRTHLTATVAEQLIRDLSIRLTDHDLPDDELSRLRTALRNRKPVGGVLSSLATAMENDAGKGEYANKPGALMAYALACLDGRGGRKAAS